MPSLVERIAALEAEMDHVQSAVKDLKTDTRHLPLVSKLVFGLVAIALASLATNLVNLSTRPNPDTIAKKVEEVIKK